MLWRKWRATVDEDWHYCFAVALWWRAQFPALAVRTATEYDLALRLLTGRRPARGWSP